MGHPDRPRPDLPDHEEAKKHARLAPAVTPSSYGRAEKVAFIAVEGFTASSSERADQELPFLPVVVCDPDASKGTLNARRPPSPLTATKLSIGS